MTSQDRRRPGAAELPCEATVTLSASGVVSFSRAAFHLYVPDEPVIGFRPAAAGDSHACRAYRCRTNGRSLVVSGRRFLRYLGALGQAQRLRVALVDGVVQTRLPETAPGAQR
jgi:hypothetical protein